MKVRLLETIDSKSGKHGAIINLCKKYAELVKKEIPNIEIQVFNSFIGGGNRMYIMTDFESMAAFDDFMEKYKSLTKAAAEGEKHEGGTTKSIMREILTFA